MSINRRHALGAFIGAATAGPKVAEGLEVLVREGVNATYAKGSDFAYDTVSKATGMDPKTLAMLKRVASGQFSDDDLQQAAWWLGDYNLEVSRSVTKHPEFDFQPLKSVSPDAKRVIVHERHYQAKRAETMATVAERLLKWS